MAKKTRDAPYVSKFDTRGDMEIWLVDDRRVCSVFDTDFTKGGQPSSLSFACVC